MRNEESLKQPFNYMESTRLPGYNSSVRNPDHPNEMRVSGRYGQTSIPVSAFMNRASNLQTQNASYELGRSYSQPQMHPLPTQSTYQAHHPLPLYNYGIQQQCVPCGPSYRLPVYYEEPMQVREEWERPLDSNVKEQQWRFVKTQDKGGIVKYVTRDEELVETQEGRWDQHYAPKTVPPPIIPPIREKRTCCTPMLFALLGLLALIGLILGLVLLLNAHGSTSSPQISPQVKSNQVEPTPGKIVEQMPAIPIMPEATVITKPIGVTRPTFTQPITAKPSQTVSTSTSTLSLSQQKVINAPAVTMTYGYQEGGSTYSGVNYNNDYQIRDSSMTYSTGVNGVTSVSSLTAEPVASVVTVPTAVIQPTMTTTTTSMTGGYDFRVPEGYRIDEFGMLVPA